jgi:hypothetical protein
MIMDFLFTERAGIDAQIRAIAATSQMKEENVMKPQ